MDRIVVIAKPYDHEALRKVVDQFFGFLVVWWVGLFSDWAFSFDFCCWLVGWLVGWSPGRSVGRSAGWLFGWLVSCTVGWLVDWLVD
jgi:hypothetical protein